jgi:dihydroorotate dehydrogenase
MYKALFRPILFLIDPETVHRLVVVMVKLISIIPGATKLIRFLFSYHHPLLKTTIAGLNFENRVGLAAGFDKNADFFSEFSMFGFSFIEVGTVTPVAQPGNPSPRLFRLPSDKALINRMGFNNKGADYAAGQLKKKKKPDLMIVGGNIGKNTNTLNESAPNDYLRCFHSLYDCVDYLAINVSCPNIKDMRKLQDQDALREILDVITKARKEKEVYKPVFLKISPDLTFRQIDETLVLCKEAGLDGIIATNTSTDRNCLNADGDTISRLGTGGLSGLPLKHRTLDIIRYICKQSSNSIPVIGVGGIIKAEDAVDMIKAGASLVQVYTGFIYDGPFLVRRSNKAIAEYLSLNCL